MKNLSVEEKRALVKDLLAKRQSQTHSTPRAHNNYTYDMFLQSFGREPSEITRFNEWVENVKQDGTYPFESPRTHEQRTQIELFRETGEKLKMLNFSSYNYLGFGYHPQVKKAAKDAIDNYGLGANSSPVISGTFLLHQTLENDLVKFFGLEGYGASLFSSGYGVNLGAISAFIKPGGYVVLDESAHMSLLEGAQLSKAEILYFKHNSPENLEEVLSSIDDKNARVLVCVEGVYSADGDYGKLQPIVKIAKKYGAFTLVDEAHSLLLSGENGRGVCEEQGVLEDVDMIVITFSKAFGGVGGALFARKEITQYVNWYAKCRMFSCALDPGVTGGMIKVLELASSEEGNIRRKRIHENAHYFRSLLQGKVDIGKSQSWIVPIMFGSDHKTLKLNDYLQRSGIDTSIMQFPAVPKNQARIRIFITSEHTKQQLDEAARIILRAADKFDFLSKA